MNTTYTNQKPGLFTAIAVMTLTSGIINLFWGFVASATVLSTFVGVVCLPLTILHTILGIFEIVYAAKLMSTQPEPIKPSQSIAVLEILTFFMGNIFSMVVGILTLIFYNDQSVKEYFARVNGVQVFTPVTTVVTPEPITESQSESPIEPELLEPDVVQEPAKPKRTRKVAGK